MDFKELLEKNKKPVGVSKYKMDEILNHVRDEHGSEAVLKITEALMDNSNSDELLAKTLADFGHPIGVSSLRRYRVTVLGVARG